MPGDGLRVERTVVVKLPVRGPGQGQRDEWTTHVPVTLNAQNGTLKFEKSPGMSGSIAWVKLDDLKALVDHFERERVQERVR